MMLHGVKTPWQPRSVGLCYWHEHIINIGCAASLVRRRRILLWRPCHWRRRAGLGSADLPDHLSCRRIPRLEKLTGQYNGQACQIVQDGEVLTFINERGDNSKGHFTSKTQVVVPDRENGLVGTLADVDKAH